MRIVQRYLTRELAANLATALGILVVVVAMLLMSLMTLRSSTANLSVSALLQLVLLVTVGRLDIMIPLATLIATLWTYGRARRDGEIDAMRGSGISLSHIIAPAVFIGSIGTLSLVWLQDEALPSAHYRQLEIGRRQLATSIRDLLLDESRTIRDRRFKCRWESRTTDTSEHVVLRDVVVSETVDPKTPPRITRARLAKPILDLDTGDLVLELHDLVRGDEIATESATVRIDLRALSSEPPPGRRVHDLSYAELFLAARRPGDVRLVRAAGTDLHARLEKSLSALLFGLLGAALGIVLRLKNRPLLFLIGFAAVLVLHYVPLGIAVGMSESGTLPAGPAVWSAGIPLLLATLLALRRAHVR